MKLGTAAKQCKGKKVRAFRACIKAKLSKGRKGKVRRAKKYVHKMY